MKATAKKVTLHDRYAKSPYRYRAAKKHFGAGCKELASAKKSAKWYSSFEGATYFVQKRMSDGSFRTIRIYRNGKRVIQL